MEKPTGRSAHRVAGRIGPWCALLFFPWAASGQLTIFPVQDLGFGQLQAGVPEVVLPTDAARRAELQVFAGKGAYTLSIVLPSQMSSLGGAVLPLLFGSTDGILTLPRGNQERAFDPSQPYGFRLTPRDGSAIIYLGGTAAPALGQPPGLYTATITVMVSNTGT